MTNEEIWLKNYELAKKCYQIYGNLLIPKNFIMKDENGDDFNIGVWLQKQRTAYYNGYLNNNHIRMLEEINMVWNIKETNEIILKNWLKRYEIAREYYKANGNLLVPQNYIVIDEDGKKANLTNWIAMQRKRYNKKELTQTQIEMLENIGMVWCIKYYEGISAYIDENYLMYQYGLLTQKNVDTLLKEEMFMTDDEGKIIKGNAIVLSRKR